VFSLKYLILSIIIKNRSDIESVEDDDVIDAPIECPGIGKWTAEMFLIFGLKRLDVLSL